MPNYKIPICLFPFSFFYDNVIAIRCITAISAKDATAMYFSASLVMIIWKIGQCLMNGGRAIE